MISSDDEYIYMYKIYYIETYIEHIKENVQCTLFN